MKQIFSIGQISWLLFTLLVAGCANTQLVQSDPLTIQLAGSTSLTPVIQALTKAFSQQYNQVAFQVRGGGSTLGEAWVAAGQVDLAATTLFHPVGGGKEERAAGGKNRTDPALTYVPFGWDAIGIIVHVTNPIQNLTLIQLRDLFSGQTLTWPQSSSPPSDVLLVSREDGSGTRKFFEEQVMGNGAVTLTAVVMPTSRDVLDYVATHPTAIGYISRSAVVQNEMDGDSDRVKMIAIEGVYPDWEQVRSRRYLLVHPIYLIRAPGPSQLWPQRFIDFALSPAGQRIVAQYHLPIR